MQGAQEAMAGGPCGHGLPPNFPGEVRGYQEPSGARHTGQYIDSPPGLNTQEQDRTGQDRPPGLNRQGQNL